jgi:tRNA-2-methylthio-N6-dimethylallyladenosine synthase
MNVYDSRKMQDIMSTVGYIPTEDINEADVVVINSCHIREKASEKIYSELGRIKLLKEAKKIAGQVMVIVVAGCTGQAEGDIIFGRAPWVDIVLGPQSYHLLPSMVKQIVEGTKRKAMDLEFRLGEKFNNLPEASYKSNSAFLSIQEGCNRFCHYCVVSYTRGPEFSRSVADIYKEALHLIHNGAVEIVLLGQNVNAYNGLGANNKPWSLAQLIKYLAKIDGLKRIRYTTSHPQNMSDDLIELHGEEPLLMPHLHLPVQSGSNAILKSMNRNHTIDDYLRVVEKITAARSDMVLSSDFIVGYPGETEIDFEDTIKLVRTVNYGSAYSFKYSPRPGTPAATYPNQIPEDVKSDRLARLQEVINECHYNFNYKAIGKEFSVLLDERNSKNVVGKTIYMHNIRVRDSDNFGSDIIDVKVEELVGGNLIGSVID